MTVFITALIAVAVLLLAAVPGYALIKFRAIPETSIPSLSKILIYICQPCLVVYSFTSTECTPEKLWHVGIFAVLCLALNIFMLGAVYLILRRKCEAPEYRIATVACVFGNCAFFGIPIIEALMPERAADLIIFTTVYATVMNILGWTVGSAIIARDRKYMSIRKIFINPVVFGLIVALILFIGKIPVNASLDSMIAATARMATPLSMMIMGMRLATVNIKKVLTNPRMYMSIFVKQIIMPLTAFLTVYFLPVYADIKRVFFITCACPVASVVLNYSELVGAGQDDAAATVLCGTAMSVLTLPLMMLLYPLIV